MDYLGQVLIASGGMGQVYAAWDPALERRVALKFLHRGQPELVERLFREARAQARIDHPNVCRVYEVGEDPSGRSFIAMQLVDGPPLGSIAAEMTLEQRGRHDLACDLIQVGRALNDLGQRRAARQHWQEAAAVIQPVAAAAPSPYVLNTYATALLELDDTDQARSVLARLLTTDWYSPELVDLARRHGIP